MKRIFINIFENYIFNPNQQPYMQTPNCKYTLYGEKLLE
jgi:hypothetical protein